MRRSKTTALLVGLVALSGCAKVRYPNYYTLNLPGSVSTARESALIPGSVAVREFRAPQFVRQGPIAFRPDPEQIAFYDYHYWAEDPRQTVTAAIVRELEGVFESASLYDGRGSANYLLTGSLDHLEEIDSGNAVSVKVGLSAKLQDSKTGEVIWSGTSSRTSGVEQRSISGIVAEMSRDLSQAATQLVSSMRIQVSKRSLSSQ